MSLPDDGQYGYVLEDLYDYTKYDWFSFDNISNSLYHAGSEPETLEELITVIRRLIPLLAERSIYPGDLSTRPDEGFLPWDLSTVEATERIVREVEQLGRFPKVTEICWFYRPYPENRPRGT